MPLQAPNPSASALPAAELGLGSFLGNDSVFGREGEGGQASLPGSGSAGGVGLPLAPRSHPAPCSGASKTKAVLTEGV